MLPENHRSAAGYPESIGSVSRKETESSAPFQNVQSLLNHKRVIDRPHPLHPMLDEIGELVAAQHGQGNGSQQHKGFLPPQLPEHQSHQSHIKRNPDFLV